MTVCGGGNSYDYYEAPRVHTLSPRRGGMDGGTAVSVIGVAFSAAGLQCRFGAMDMNGSRVSLVSSSLIVCVSPSSFSAGNRVAVEVSVNDGADFTCDATRLEIVEHGQV